MRILGVYAGIGSPMVQAFRMGHTIVGNIEPRGFAHVFDNDGNNTFLENFPGSFLVNKFEDVPVDLIKDIDIIAGHPKCGTYSNLVNKSGQERIDYASKQSDDFLEFIRIVNLVKPKFAFFDNLPKSLEANPPSLYEELMPDYNVDIEYVSNYYYGNSQFNRNRLFVIASLKEIEYGFMPGELPNNKTLESVIWDLQEPGIKHVPNHDIHSVDAMSNSGRRVYQDGPMTWKQVAQTFRDKEKIGDYKALHYFTPNGEKKHHFGFRMPRYDRPSPTLIGTHPVINPKTYLPLSIRERARVMGFPDDFVFYGTKFEDDGTWVHNKNASMIQQTGRCIPCEFPGFLIDQFVNHIGSLPGYRCSMKRIAKMNKYFDNEDCI